MRRRIRGGRPQPALIVSVIALVLAAGGTSYAALTITGADIKDETVTTRDVKNNSLRTADFHRSALSALQGPGGLMWIDHFSFLAGDASVSTSHNAVSSGVGGGLTGLVVGSSTVGDTGSSGGNKVVHRALEVPPGYRIRGVRVCYELTSQRSFITQIRLAQVQPVPSSAGVILDDGTDHTATGPVCVDSSATSVDPSAGAVLISLRVNFGDTSDRIVLRGVGLRLTPA